MLCSQNGSVHTYNCEPAVAGFQDALVVLRVCLCSNTPHRSSCFCVRLHLQDDDLRDAKHRTTRFCFCFCFCLLFRKVVVWFTEDKVTCLACEGAGRPLRRGALPSIATTCKRESRLPFTVRNTSPRRNTFCLCIRLKRG